MFWDHCPLLPNALCVKGHYFLVCFYLIFFVVSGRGGGVSPFPATPSWPETKVSQSSFYSFLEHRASGVIFEIPNEYMINNIKFDILNPLSESINILLKILFPLISPSVCFKFHSIVLCMVPARLFSSTLLD